MSRSRIKYIGVALATLGAVLTIGGLIALKSLPGVARRILIADLQTRFHSTIEIGEIKVHGLIPVRIVARDITLRYQGRSDVPPLMTIERLTGYANLHGWWSGNWRISSIHMDGLQIRIPPREDHAAHAYLVPQAHPKLRLPPVEVDEIIADNALLQIFPRQKERKPHSFSIHHLTLRSVGRGKPAYFHAQLTNEVPTGEIDSEGTFGPWDADQPSLTPVAANFAFANADLGQFRGLVGTLSSTGHYGGVLERLDVEGQASVTNFGLTLTGNRVELRTHYVAVVDGMNGNTYLTTVEAHFLQTTLKVKGEIIDPPGPPHRRILLSVAASDARAEDLLRLVTKGNSAAVAGAVNLRAQFELPSGSGDIVDRLSLRCDFEISGAGFANRQTQAKIDTLSRRGQGKSGKEGVSDVLSDIRGSLVVADSQAYFSRMEFAVPGAFVFLKGSYGLRTEAIDLHGQLRLSSKLSQTTKGVRSALLRILDPFFRDGAGGSILPIKITGSRSNPSFELELRRHSKPTQTVMKSRHEMPEPGRTN